MSKTDKTNPYWVKWSYDPAYLEPIHRHEFHECDLPPRPVTKELKHNTWFGKRDDSCFWYPSFSFYRSRWAKCGCYMCSRYAYEADPNKKRRRDDKRYTSGGWRDEY